MRCFNGCREDKKRGDGFFPIEKKLSIFSRALCPSQNAPLRALRKRAIRKEHERSRREEGACKTAQGGRL